MSDLYTAVSSLKSRRAIVLPQARTLCHRFPVTNRPPRAWWPAAGLIWSAAVFNPEVPRVGLAGGALAYAASQGDQGGSPKL